MNGRPGVLGKRKKERLSPLFLMDFYASFFVVALVVEFDGRYGVAVIVAIGRPYSRNQF